MVRELYQRRGVPALRSPCEAHQLDRGQPALTGSPPIPPVAQQVQFGHQADHRAGRTDHGQASMSRSGKKFQDLLERGVRTHGVGGALITAATVISFIRSSLTTSNSRRFLHGSAVTRGPRTGGPSASNSPPDRPGANWRGYPPAQLCVACRRGYGSAAARAVARVDGAGVGAQATVGGRRRRRPGRRCCRCPTNRSWCRRCR